ncbi:TPA: hypothetical protein O4G40_004535 [Vibrio alginolyticus]|nr:hypothetical protein [Vibrio alginolyticus]
MEIVLAIATLLGGVTAVWFFWDKAREFTLGTSKVNTHDLELFEQYKGMFVTTGAAEFYRQHDFLAQFSEDYWRPLSSYVDNWYKPDFEFSNSKLQKQHKTLYEAAEKLGTAIAGNTVTIAPTYKMRSVRPDNLAFGPIPDHIKEEAKEINGLVPAFIKAHDDFVKLGNRELY